MKSLTIKLISLLVAGSIGVGAFASGYLQRTPANSSEETNRIYWEKKGLKLTAWDDQIWEKAFLKYKDENQKDIEDATELGLDSKVFNRFIANSPQELKSKCKEFLNLSLDKNKSKMTLADFDKLSGVEKYKVRFSPFMFTGRFCAWKTNLFDYLKAVSNYEMRKLNTKGDENIWDYYTNDLKYLLSDILNKRIDIDNHYDSASLKQELKELCSKVNWNIERHGFYEIPYIFFCTDNPWKAMQDKRD